MASRSRKRKMSAIGSRSNLGSGHTESTPRNRPNLSWTVVLQNLSLLVLLAIGIISRARYYGYCIHDDSFISFRYARNLVRGHGLVMNPGEQVEGFTNFLWTLGVAPVLVLGGDPEVFTQWAGAVLSLGLIVGLFVFSIRHLRSGWFSLIAPAFLVGNLAFVMESLSGLETMLFAALAFGTTWAFLDSRQRDSGGTPLWAALAAAASLVRPEGAMLFAMLWAYAGIGVLRGESPRRLWQPALVFLLLILPFLLWRFEYYGEWLPNTFFTKVGYTAAQLARGWRYTVHVLAFGITQPLLIGSLVMGVIGLLVPRLLRPETNGPSWNKLFAAQPRREALALALMLTITHLVYVLLVGGDYEPTARFYMPVFAWIYFLIQESCRTLFLLGNKRGPRTGALIGIVATGLVLLGLYQSERRFILLLQSRGWPMTRWEQHQQAAVVGKWFNQNTRTGSRIALSSIGALPWYTDRPILDMMGLTDSHIARRVMPRMGQGPAGHEKGDGAYVLSRQPTIILFDKGYRFDHEANIDEVLRGARGISELEIAASPTFLQLYELRRAHTPVGILHWFQLRSAPSPNIP